MLTTMHAQALLSAGGAVVAECLSPTTPDGSFKGEEADSCLLSPPSSAGLCVRTCTCVSIKAPSPFLPLQTPSTQPPTKIPRLRPHVCFPSSLSFQRSLALRVGIEIQSCDSKSNASSLLDSRTVLSNTEARKVRAQLARRVSWNHPRSNDPPLF